MLEKLIVLFTLSAIVFLSGCSEAADQKPVYVEKASDIVDKHGNIKNHQRFNQFLKNVRKGKEDAIRIVHYTKEGDAILYDYEFKNNVIHVTHDNSHDNYGETEIVTATCQKIKEHKHSDRTDYTLIGCADPAAIDTDILTIQR